MHRSALRSLLFVLTLVAVWPARAGAQAIVVEVDNDARIPTSDLAEMEQVVVRSYLAIGVQVLWEHGEVAFDDPRGLRVHLRLLSRMKADQKIRAGRIGRDVLGRTNRPARLLYIFWDRIVEVSAQHDHDSTDVLGLVVAHELAHVFLPAHRHSARGIMKGGINLRAKIAHEFTPEEGEAIRAMVQAGSERTRPTSH